MGDPQVVRERPAHERVAAHPPKRGRQQRWRNPGDEALDPKERPRAKKTTTPEPVEPIAPVESAEPVEQTDATALLVRAARVGLQKSDDEWVHSSSVKSQMQRMAPEFKEKALGYTSFRAFVESRADILETKQLENGQLLVRLK